METADLLIKMAGYKETDENFFRVYFYKDAQNIMEELHAIINGTSLSDKGQINKSLDTLELIERKTGLLKAAEHLFRVRSSLKSILVKISKI